MTSVICENINQLVDHRLNRHTPNNTIKHTRAKVLSLVSTLKQQVSWVDTYNEVVNHHINLARASK